MQEPVHNCAVNSGGRPVVQLLVDITVSASWLIFKPDTKKENDHPGQAPQCMLEVNVCLQRRLSCLQNEAIRSSQARLEEEMRPDKAGQVKFICDSHANLQVSQAILTQTLL